IEAGKSVLIEKPIATSKEKARDLVALAAKHNVVLQVGHQERFVLKAIGLYQIASCPMKIETQRLTPYSLRGRDTSVTFDLMIHDIDLVLSLMGNMPSCIEGHTMQVALNHIDASLAFLDFGKTRARLTASRADDVPVRTMRLVYPEGEVNIDFNAKTLVNGTPFDLDENFGQNPIAQDSLAAGLDSFISAIMGVHSVEISGEDGLRAVIVATEIDQN
ncbi:MAG: Gfo/Idh/MocA family oxidoreductase, partial [Maricaulaceae bacterium]